MAFHGSSEYSRVPNSADGIASLLDILRPLKPQLIVLEALCQAGLPAVAVNPKRVRDFAKSTGKLAKTDRIDARVIAHYAALIKPEVRSLSDEQTQHLQVLILRRSQLIDTLSGRCTVRRALYMACGAAQRANPNIKAFCDRLRANGKKTKVAFVAGIRKLLTQLNAMMRDSTPWSPTKAGLLTRSLDLELQLPSLPPQRN